MPLVNAKCTNCGANLQVDNTKDAAICQYCGSAYVVEKAINNYNTVNNITANVVNIYGGNSADFVIRAGVLEKYNGASIHVVIPNSVRCIARRAFANTHIESVDIPDSVKVIEEQAFAHCTELREIHIPDTVTTIGDAAFLGCSSLIRAVIPSKLSEIRNATFAECTSLASVNIPKSVKIIAKRKEDYEMLYDLGAFDRCSKLVNVNFEDDETAERLCWHFPLSPIAQQKQAEIKALQKREWRRAGVCDLCGGNFKGLIIKKCTRCGKEKQY